MSLFLFGVTKITSPTPGIESSWRTGINVASAEGMRFGHDIIFTYGPLGFLDTTQSLSRPQIVLSMAFSLAATASLWTVVYLGIVRTTSRIAAAVTSTVLVGVVSGTGIILPSFQILLSASITTLLFIKSNGSGNLRWTPAVVSAVAAILIQVKFPEGIVLTAIAGLCALYSPSRARRRIVEASLTFCVAFAVGWTWTGQAFADVPSWFVRYLDVSLGYSEAMAREHAPNPLSYPMAIFLAIALVTLAMRWADAGARRARAGILLVVLCLLVFSFKLGFTRHDAHESVFFGVTAALFATLLEAAKRPRVVMVFLAMSLVFASAGASQFYPTTAREAWRSNLQPLVDYDHQQLKLQQAALAARSFYSLPADIVSSTNGHPVSVDPWETTLAWAYNFNWRPVPIFQAYVAYTATLDQLNADAIVNAPPDQVVIRGLPSSIDYRNAMWETPRYLLAVACNYVIGPSDNKWMTLHKSGQRCSAPSEISVMGVDAGRRITLPSVQAGEILVGHFTPDASSPPSMVMHALWKDYSPLMVQADGVEYRLPKSLADGPLLLHVPGSLGWPNRFGGNLHYKELVFSQPGRLTLETVIVEAD